MALEVSYSCEKGAQPALELAEFERIFATVLEAEGVERPCNVSLSIVSEATMQSLNAEWRGVDKPTDVISLECERPTDPDLASGEPCELGDIFMAPAVLAAQAPKFKTSVEDETRLMAIHSLLHLLGYDHIEEAQAKIMEAREDELLALVTDTMGHVELTRHEAD